MYLKHEILEYLFYIPALLQARELKFGFFTLCQLTFISNSDNQPVK